MATIKSCTNVEQSRKLAEFLTLESADMIWDLTNPDLPTIRAIPYEDSDYNNKYLSIIPAWSLAALLKLIPNFNMFKRTIECKIETTNHSIDKACDLVDAAFEMVCWLKENNEL